MSRRRLGAQLKVYQPEIELCLVGTLRTLSRVHILLPEMIHQDTEFGDSRHLQRGKRSDIEARLHSEYHLHFQCCPTYTVIVLLHSRTGGHKLLPAGLTWPAAFFCMAQRPRTVLHFQYLKKAQKEYFCDIGKCNFYRQNFIGSQPCSFVCILSMTIFTLRGRVEELLQRL